MLNVHLVHNQAIAGFLLLIVAAIGVGKNLKRHNQ